MLVYASVEQDGRLVLPPVIRTALGLSPGDFVGFDLDGPRAILVRVAMIDQLDALAEILPEWATEPDGTAYDAL